MSQIMREGLILSGVLYMLAGMFFLVASGALGALVGSLRSVINERGWLPVTRFLLRVIAVVQVTLFWALWPLVLWHATRIGRRRAP